MYQKVLIDQWKNLYSDFAEEYELLQSQGDAVTAFNRWYEARVHRWSSVAYSEGIILEQENKPDFSEELQHVIKKFQFNKVEADGETSLWMGTVAGVALGTLGTGSG